PPAPPAPYPSYWSYWSYAPLTVTPSAPRTTSATPRGWPAFALPAWQTPTAPRPSFPPSASKQSTAGGHPRWMDPAATMPDTPAGPRPMLAYVPTATPGWTDTAQSKGSCRWLDASSR